MIIKRIVLENIRSYISETIEFPSGSTLISGDIGAGKSTILLAIEFALFGTLRGDLSGGSLLRNGEKKGSVSLFFDIGKSIEIYRSLSRTKNEDVVQGAGYISIDDVKTDCTAVELKSRVLELLGYPSDLLTKSKSLIYRYTVYTPQEMMKQILFDDAESRLNVLRKVFGIDKYKRIRENSTIYVKHLRDLRNRFEGEISVFSGRENELNVKRSEVSKVDESLRLVLSEVDLKQKEIILVKSEVDVAFKEVEELNKLKRELSFNEQMISDKIKNITGYENRRSSLDMEMLELEGKLKLLIVPDISKVAIENEILLKEKNLNSTLIDKTRISERISFLEKSIVEYGDRIKLGNSKILRLISLRDELKNLKSNISLKSSIVLDKTKFESEFNLIVSKISELNSHMVHSSDIKSGVLKLVNCPTCYQNVGGEHKERMVKDESAKILKWKDEIFGLEQKRDAVKIKLNLINQKYDSVLSSESMVGIVNLEIKNLEELELEVKKYNSELSRFTLELNNLNGKIVSDSLIALLNEDLARLRSDLSKINQRESLSYSLIEKKKFYSELSHNIAVFKEEVAKLEKDKFEIQSKIKNLSSSNYISLKEKYDLLLSEEKKLELNRAEYMRDREHIVFEILRIESDIKLLVDKKEKLSFVNDVVNWFGTYFVSVSELIEKQILLRTYNEFNELFVTWFDKLIEDDLLSVRLDDTFTPVVVQNGYEASLSDLSGGEKTACSLAYRLALNKVINDVMSTINTSDLIILDEPTDGFSSEQLDRVKDVLDDLGMKQIIIVSHEPKIETYVDNVIRVVKDEHVSRVV